MTAAEKQMEFLMGVMRADPKSAHRTQLPAGQRSQSDFLRPASAIWLFSASRRPICARWRGWARRSIRGTGDRPKGAATAVVGATEIYLPLDDLINLDEERGRLAKEVGKIEDELARVQKKLGNSDFLAKAKEEVMQKERDKAGQFDEKLRTLQFELREDRGTPSGKELRSHGYPSLARRLSV